MRFLMVDDSSTMRRIIINTLNQLGYTEVVEASKGRKGIDKSNVADADMVITDWNMPEMNGIDFVRNLRATA
jgi:two-component system chemotaxis response regulator CheY